jgi:hypothetical protein
MDPGFISSNFKLGSACVCSTCAGVPVHMCYTCSCATRCAGVPLHPYQSREHTYANSTPLTWAVFPSRPANFDSKCRHCPSDATSSFARECLRALWRICFESLESPSSILACAWRSHTSCSCRGRRTLIKGFCCDVSTRPEPPASETVRMSSRWRICCSNSRSCAGSNRSEPAANSRHVPASDHRPRSAYS